MLYLCIKIKRSLNLILYFTYDVYCNSMVDVINVIFEIIFDVIYNDIFDVIFDNMSKNMF